MAKRAANPRKRAKFGGIFENKLRRISRLGRFNSQKYSLKANAGYVLLKVDTALADAAESSYARPGGAQSRIAASGLRGDFAPLRPGYVTGRPLTPRRSGSRACALPRPNLRAAAPSCGAAGDRCGRGRDRSPG